MQDRLYLDHTQPIEVRVNDLVSQMTLEEKVSQMQHGAAAIDRLGVPQYNWWNECLHGVGRAGIATVFPQAIGMAATWNTDLLFRVATAISDEGRAKHHEFVRQGIRDIYTGLTFWTPNINIFRDPRWGRGQETYGEDPYLTASIGVAFVRGLQGNHPHYLKVAACAKHFAVHSGPESERHTFDAQVSERDLRDTYLFAFEALVREGSVEAVMGAYNRTNGEPCCASPTLLEKILRQEWGFKGHVVSDCWAIVDIYAHHNVVQTPEQAAALAVRAGCDVECGSVYPSLVQAVRIGLVSEYDLDRSVRRLFTTRMKLGMFDPDTMNPYAQIPYSVNDSQPHKELALQTARESMVLLKNANNTLPLSKDLKTIAVIGPNADWQEVLWGNYNGTPSSTVTPLQGIRAATSAEVLYTRGSGIQSKDTSGFAEAVEIAKRADVAIVVVGLSQAVEGEEGQEEGVEVGEKSSGDRFDITLPGVQEDLLKAIHATGTPLVVVLVNGSAVAINWADENAAAIVEAWYPGQAGGTALADVLFGDYNPAGRLPVTFYKSIDQLPPFRDYAMTGRTYRYMTAEPLYPFGYGLSYTQFAYSDLHITPDAINANGQVSVSATITNIGNRAGDEVVQLYIQDVESSVARPKQELKGFARVHLAPSESKTVHFTLDAGQFSFYENGAYILEPGRLDVLVGASSSDIRLQGSFLLVGGRTEINTERVFFTQVSSL
jgi:beta-glucosidase